MIEFTGFLAIDPILGILFGFVLLWASWGIMGDAMHLLMEGTPPGVNLQHVVAKLTELESVKDIHHVHAWALTSNRNVFSAHLVLETGKETESNRIQRRAHAILKDEFGFYFSTLQLESTCLDEVASGAIDTTISGDQPQSNTGGAGGHHHG